MLNIKRRFTSETHRAQIITQFYMKITSVSPWRSFRPRFHRWTLLLTCAGVFWRRGEAEAAGGLPPDQNSALHARPGAVPATSGPHRRRQRTGRLGAATPAAVTVLPPPTQPDLHHLSPRGRRRGGGGGCRYTDCVRWCVNIINIQYYRCFIWAILL